MQSTSGNQGACRQELHWSGVGAPLQRQLTMPPPEELKARVQLPVLCLRVSAPSLGAGITLTSPCPLLFACLPHRLATPYPTPWEIALGWPSGLGALQRRHLLLCSFLDLALFSHTRSPADEMVSLLGPFPLRACPVITGSPQTSGAPPRPGDHGGCTQDRGASLWQLERGSFTAAPGPLSGAGHGATKLPGRPRNVAVSKTGKQAPRSAGCLGWSPGCPLQCLHSHSS